MASLEAILLTETIDAYEGKDIMVMDITNTFIYTNILPKKYGEESLIMKIAIVLVEMLLEQDSEICSKHVIFENVEEVIYIVE